jgi:hypothetical protein
MIKLQASSFKLQASGFRLPMHFDECPEPHAVNVIHLLQITEGMRHPKAVFQN